MNGLRVENLTVEYVKRPRLGHKEERRHKALADISFALPGGETIGIVGESGCGKTTLGHAVLQMTPVSAGRVLWDGTEITALKGAALRPFRRQMQLVFQDPFEAMNPRMTVDRIVSEPLHLAFGMARSTRRQKAAELLQRVGLDEAVLSRYPRQLSGGQRQRVALARALATEPRLLVLDEPTSGLDVSLQARILNLLRDLQAEKGLSYLFISHDLSAISYIAHRTVVLFGGHMMEQGPTATLIRSPAHPYTASLLAALPVPAAGRPAHIASDPVPRAGALPSMGCIYCPWCDRAQSRCHFDAPGATVLEGERVVACHYPLPDNRQHHDP